MTDLEQDTAAAADLGVGVAVDIDPSVWLPGPTTQTPAEWLELAKAGCARDFGIAAGSAEEGYLADLLEDFAARDLFGQFRFLRLRSLTDTPLVMQLGVFADAPEGELAATLTDMDPEMTYYDREPQIDVIDEQRGLRRSIAYQVVDGIRPVVRYHRRVAEIPADVVLSCAGADLRAVAQGLPELDRLAQGVWLVDEEGVRH